MGAPNRQLVWSIDAEDDLVAIWRFGAEEWSPDIADAHANVLWRVCSRLTQNPELGKSRSELAEGLRSLPANPHVIFYRTSDSAIEIVRVIHQSEDVDTIFE